MRQLALSVLAAVGLTTAAAAAALKRASGADGFDRLLVSQAIAEPLRLLTANEVLKQYSELVEVASGGTA